MYKKLGEWTITGSAVGVAGGATAVYWYGIPFVEFVSLNASLLKAYLILAFQNPQLISVVDSIVQSWSRFKRHLADA